ncbi:hypothetical protein HDU96_009447 [Phlyctochytrium bullatum]|nr:hypothetical protein HDU96_009447 [Phlyctochytrium bullatum]
MSANRFRQVDANIAEVLHTLMEDLNYDPEREAREREAANPSSGGQSPTFEPFNHHYLSSGNRSGSFFDEDDDISDDDSEDGYDPPQPRGMFSSPFGFPSMFGHHGPPVKPTVPARPATWRPLVPHPALQEPTYRLSGFYSIWTPRVHHPAPPAPLMPPPSLPFARYTPPATSNNGRSVPEFRARL